MYLTNVKTMDVTVSPKSQNRYLGSEKPTAKPLSYWAWSYAPQMVDAT